MKKILSIMLLWYDDKDKKKLWSIFIICLKSDLIIGAKDSLKFVDIPSNLLES